MKTLRVLAACSSIACACGGSTSASPGPGDGSAADSPTGSDAASDAGGSDGATGSDGTGPGDGSSADAPAIDAGDFPSTVEGIWLIGWAGNLNHYSWVRFDSLQAGGAADYLSGADLTANTPYWNCAGTGNWVLAQKPQTVALTFPASCSAQAIALTFDSVKPHSGYPLGATLDANITVEGTGQMLNGWKFPSSQCDAGMTKCTNPF